MSFDELKLPLSIKTTSANPIDVFFNPVLASAKTYDVAVGFFTSQWVRDAAKGIAQFALNGGRARWIVSPILSTEDRDSICASSEGVEELVIKSFEALYEELKSNTRTILAWLIKDEILSFQIGVPQNKLSGMLHAKMGVFSDSAGNQIGFSGSYNLTGNAATNWEKIDIYCDWKSEESSHRIDEIKAEFAEMWGGYDPNLAVFKPSDKALKPFLVEAEHTKRPYKTPAPRPRYAIAEGFELRDYQNEAIGNWLGNDGTGFLSMATGAGKTITALSAAARIANFATANNKPHLIVTTAPYQHLAEQWAEEAKMFGFEPLLCYGGSSKWIAPANRMINELKIGVRQIAFFISVNDTFASKKFQKTINGLQRQLLLIADEAHSLGANHYRNALPLDARFRLGLSATPVRHGDEEGTKALEEYFGKVVYEFSLKDAISMGFLCKYKYIPVLCPLSKDEMEEYKDISTKIGKEFARSGKYNDEYSNGLRYLLIERARLITRVSSKISKLWELMSDIPDSSYNLVYCGDTKDQDVKQVDKVTSLLGGELGMRVHKFTSDENMEERKELLQSFSVGEIQTLIAIRCLDEGVDVPKTERAFILASSVNPRQYIQRRGRVLRKAKGKRFATIYDFVAIPNLDEMTSLDSKSMAFEKGLLRRELERINEFASSSINPGETLKTMRKIRERLQLLDT